MTCRAFPGMPPIDFRLLLVTDRHQIGPRSLPLVLQQAIRAGNMAIQLRERDLMTRDLVALAREVRTITAAHSVRLLVNDRVDLTLALHLDGVHLRANSFSAAVARRLLGPNRLIGVSTHSIEEVLQANRDGADYVMFGPIFDTLSKRPFGTPRGVRELAEACRRSTAPVFAIGGVMSERVPDVRQAGAYGIAVIGAVFAREDVAAATGELLRALES